MYNRQSLSYSSMRCIVQVMHTQSNVTDAYASFVILCVPTSVQLNRGSFWRWKYPPRLWYLTTVTGWSCYINFIWMYQFLNIIYLDNIQSTLLEKRWWRRNITPEGHILWVLHLLIDVHGTSIKLTTNRCWTRAMGGEQETHIGDCSLIMLDQDKEDWQRKLTIFF